MMTRGKRIEEIIDEMYLDCEDDEISNVDALRMIVYFQDDWEYRINLFEPLRAKAILDSRVEKKVFVCKDGPISWHEKNENDNDYFFTESGRFVLSNQARVLKKVVNILSDEAVYIVLTSDGKKTITLPQ